MPEELFESESGLALIIPKELVERFHLKPGTLVETMVTKEGILLKPIETGPNLSSEWKEALDTVMKKFRPALDKLAE